MNITGRNGAIRPITEMQCSACRAKQNAAMQQYRYSVAANWPQSDGFVLAGLLPPGPLVDLVIMDLAFLAPRCHRHAYAFAGVGAAGGTVPTFFIGIDYIAQFATDHPDVGDQRADIAVNVDPELHH